MVLFLGQIEKVPVSEMGSNYFMIWGIALLMIGLAVWRVTRYLKQKRNGLAITIAVVYGVLSGLLILRAESLRLPSQITDPGIPSDLELPPAPVE